jgi:hypothetical protein
MIVVDGASTPDLIPDDLASRHFLAAVATSGRPSTADLKRIDLVVSAIGLSAKDRVAFEEAVRGLSDKVAAAERATAPGTPGSRRTEVLDSVRDELCNQLSSIGHEKFEQFIRSHVRPKITIYRWSATTKDHSHAAVH